MAPLKKKPAAPEAPEADGTDKELPEPTEEEQAKLDFFANDHKARKAAYGRLSTAVEKYDGPLKDQLLQQYNETQTPGVANRWAKARQMLEDWVLDPSFGRSVARYTIEAENEEELRSDDEIEQVQA